MSKKQVKRARRLARLNQPELTVTETKKARKKVTIIPWDRDFKKTRSKQLQKFTEVGIRKIIREDWVPPQRLDQGNMIGAQVRKTIRERKREAKATETEIKDGSF